LQDVSEVFGYLPVLNHFQKSNMDMNPNIYERKLQNSSLLGWSLDAKIGKKDYFF